RIGPQMSRFAGERAEDAVQQARHDAVQPSKSTGSELGKLFQQHNDSLVQLLRARLRSDQEARDVAQEAYVKLLQLDAAPGTISYLRTYLFRTALNIATDRLRSAAVHHAAHRDPVFDQHIDELTPEKRAVAKEQLERVQGALAGLPARERYAFLLHRFADMDVE